MNDTIIMLAKFIYGVSIVLYILFCKSVVKKYEEIDNSLIIIGIVMLAFGIFVLMISD